jgi:hypothetical protein
MFGGKSTDEVKNREFHHGEQKHAQWNVVAKKSNHGGRLTLMRCRGQRSAAWIVACQF